MEQTEQKPQQQPEPQATDKELSPAGSGDDRTPDKTIGEVKYAGGGSNKPGGAGAPQVSDLEPEKQGGIGGP
jgi:hypothetical protein